MANAGPLADCLTAPSRTFEDVDEFRDHLAGWDLDFTQLAAGPVVGSHAMAHIGSVLVQGGETLVPLLQRGAAPPHMTFSILARASIRVTSRGHDLAGDRVFVNRPGEEIHWRSGPDFRVRTLSVSEERLRAVARELDLERGVQSALRAHTVRPSPASMAILRRALFDDPTNGLGRDGQPRPTAASADIERRLLHLLTYALASHEGSAEPERLRRLDQVMLRVQEVLNQYPDRAFSREELSEAVGVSDRSIRRASHGRGRLPRRSATRGCCVVLATLRISSKSRLWNPP